MVNQTTAATNSVRIAVNAAIRALTVPNQTGCFETADAAESARDSGLWKTIPTTGTLVAGTTAVTALPTGHGLVKGQHVFGPHIPASCTLTAVTTNAATLSAAALAGAGSGETIIGSFTTDGIHPEAGGSNAMAGAVTLSAIAA